MLDRKAYLKACECLRTIAHPDRLKMIQILLKKESQVKELAKICNIRPNVASEHLTIMKDRDLLEATRIGRDVFYKIKEKALSNIFKCIEKRFSK
ncbi:MAG: putative HTH-type transcriptional regulator YgaV [Candidatus Anoxychlamydiales bacterium]|nr:putative HTH-type transcriptional regulator YgaV [Candidatus Anoxychlamydiales bacterium]NGX35717.1 putative HTH-type transcriptional regulator YgaV [Candidatus Anoxychlamydiales bacterium]